ncbi:MAG: hypothetical protein NVS3B24_14400 [Candidatus Dormibacteria bacterium]
MPAEADWTTYHRDNHRTGELAGDGAVPANPASAWKTALDGLIYAEPLVYGNQVIVATEENTVYSLDLQSGRVNWSQSVAGTGGHPVPRNQLPCGNLATTGVTGTPVIDPVSGKLFLVAESWDGVNQASDHHYFWALDLNRRGNPTVAGTSADPPSGFDPRTHQHRAAMAIANGAVYFAYGGRSGDCEPYHGWVGRINQDGTNFIATNVTARGARGGIWAPSGPAIDDAGNVFVATGNGNQGDNAATADLTDSVVKLSADLAILDHFTPIDWGTENIDDTDLGSTGPLLLGSGLVYQVGKSGTAYLLNSASLGGGQNSGGAAWQGAVCQGYGGSAYKAATDVIFSTCSDGVRALKLHRVGSGACGGGTEPCLEQLWRGPGDASGPPIVAGHTVWVRSDTFGSGSVTLYGLDEATGQTTTSLGGLDGSAHFVTPTVASGTLLMTVGSAVQAWTSACSNGPGGPPGYNILNTSGGLYSFGDARYFGNLIDHGYPGPGVGLAETPSGLGYQILTSTGALYSFGDAVYYGNLLDHGYPGPATAVAYTPAGTGYSILTRGGGIYSFGDAPYFGNLIDHGYPGEATGLAYTPSGQGYWILTRQGGIYSFGDATYYGNLIDHGYPGEAVSLAASSAGYGILTTSGALYTFGDQPYLGNLLDHCYPGPAAAISNTP